MGVASRTRERDRDRAASSFAAKSTFTLRFLLTFPYPVRSRPSSAIPRRSRVGRNSPFSEAASSLSLNIACALSEFERRKEMTVSSWAYSAVMIER